MTRRPGAQLSRGIQRSLGAGAHFRYKTITASTRYPETRGIRVDLNWA